MIHCMKSSWPVIPLIVMFFALSASAIELLQGFPFNTEFEMQTAPKVADFDLDGDDEIVVGTDAGPGVPGQEYVYIIRGDGSVILEKALPDGIRAATAIGDIDDNGTLDIVAVQVDGGGVCAFDYTGEDLAGFPVLLGDVDILAAPTLMDIDGDEKLEILVGLPRDEDNLVLLSFDGNVIWQRTVARWVKGSPAIGDCDGDFIPEIFLSTTHEVHDGFNLHFYCINATTGETRWDDVLSSLYFSESGPAVADVDNDGDLEVIFAYHDNRVPPLSPEQPALDPGGVLVVYDACTGESVPLPTMSLPGHPGTAVAVARVLGQPQLQMLITSSASGVWGGPTLYCFDYNGEAVWVAGDELGLRGSRSSATIGDCNNDGEQEILINTLSFSYEYSSVYGFKTDGTLADEFPVFMGEHFGMDNYSVPTVAFGNFNGDDYLDFACAMSVNNGFDPPYPGGLWAWSTQHTEGGRIEWASFQNDCRNTGLYEQPASGYVEQNATLQGRIVLWGDLVVADGVTLTVEPGTQIRVRDGFEIAVNPAGQLIIEGEEGNPVVITSASANPTPGIWHGIWLNEGAYLTAEYCVIEDANNGIYAKPSTQVNVAHCTFKNCLNSGFYGSGATSSHSISRSIFQDCGNYGAMFYGGNPVFDYNKVLGCKYGIKYLGDGTVYIRNNVIDASGMSAQNYWGIYVGPNSPTDTPTPLINGDSITFFDQGGIYVASSYGSGALNGSIRSKHNTIYGLYLTDSSPSLSCLGDATHNTFSYSTYGVYCTKQCNSVFHWNKVVKNTFGVFIDRAATPNFGNAQSQGNNKIEKDALGVYEMKSDNTSYTVPARGNWWGMDGPQVIGNIDAGGALISDPMGGLERREAPGSASLPEKLTANIHPNPFNTNAEIRFSLPEQTDVSVAVYDISGRLVKELASGAYPAGEHAVVWDGTNESGERVTSGVYLYSVSASPDKRVLGKMVLLK